MVEPLIEALAGSHTVIAVDAPGYGESASLPVDAPTVEDYSSALAGAFPGVLHPVRARPTAARPAAAATVKRRVIIIEPSVVFRALGEGRSKRTIIDNRSQVENR